MKIKLLSLFITLFCFTFYAAKSQITVSVPDTAIPAGSVYKIPVKAKIDSDTIRTLTLVFTYNSHIIYVKRVGAGGNYLMKCDTPQTKYNYFDLTSVDLEIKCDSLNKPQKDTSEICFLEIEGLTYRDTTIKLELAKIIINGSNTIEKNEFVSNITVNSIGVIQAYPEGLSYNFPNPFFGKTTFPFSINEPTKVDFKVFSLIGIQCLSSDNLEKNMIIYKRTKNGNVRINNLKDPLTQGSYLLEVYPSWELYFGVYYMIMETENNVYSRTFVYVN